MSMSASVPRVGTADIKTMITDKEVVGEETEATLNVSDSYHCIPPNAGGAAWHSERRVE